MTRLKLLGAASLFVLAMAASPAFAVNDAAPAAPSVNQPQTAPQIAPQAAPRPQLSPEERKAKRQHRREMRRKRQLERQPALQPGRQNSPPPQQP